MIIASEKQQQLLLEIANLDLAVSRAETTLGESEKNSQAEALRSQVLESSERLLQAHGNVENLESEIKKLATDVEMVEARIEHDKQKATQVTNEREQKAVTQELDSLRARLSSLEEAEFDLMEKLESASSLVEEITKTRTRLNLELEEALKKQHGEALTISAQITELRSKRSAAFAQLDEALQVLYTRKSQRGIAVAQTLGRDCSACRLSINAVQFEAMLAEPADHLPTCPNCDALIIR